MADENQENIQTPANEQRVYSENEQAAMAEGWRPKDEWQGDPDDWKSANEFLRAGKLFKKIEEQGRTIKELRNATQLLAEHNKNIQKVEFERAMAVLKSQKREALEQDDVDAAVEIDDKILELRERQKALPAVQVPQETVAAELNPVFVAWVERNQWYNSSPAMKAYADAVGNRLGAEGGRSPTDILAAVEREVKKEFAHKFTNPNRDKPGAVESGGKAGGGKADAFVLSDEERRVMKRILKVTPHLTEEKYMADLKKIKGVS